MTAAAPARLIKRQYVAGHSGQIHVRSLENAGAGSSPLLCLHPAPYSGLYFETFMPLLTSPRSVLAPDYPGYGGSDLPAGVPTIGDYAEALTCLIDSAGQATVDLLGFHTGCLVAAELTRIRPEKVGRLILIDVPYFSAEERALLLQESAPPQFTAELGSLQEAFDFTVAKRLNQMSYDRALELFAEQLRAGRHAHYALQAAFGYAPEETFRGIRNQGLVVATQGRLSDATRSAAEILTGMSFIQRPDIMRSVFEESAAKIAVLVDDFLSDQGSE